MHRIRAGAAVVIVLLLSSCGDGRRRGTPTGDAGPGVDSGGPTVDAGGSDAGADAGGPGGSCDDLPPATVVTPSVRTAYPHITVTEVNGFGVRSVNYVITEDGDSRGPLIEVLVEVENTTSSTECDFLPDARLGITDLTGLVETPPYYGEYVDTVTNDCLGPGDVGVFNGLARGVTEASLATESSLFLDLSPSTIGTNYRATDGPTVLSAEIVAVEGGWGVQGQLSVPTTVRNYNLTFYARDERGLLTSELQAYPRELDTLYAGETVAFETLAPAPCDFVEHLAFPSWIVGASSGFFPSFSGGPDIDSLQAARREAAARLRAPAALP